MTLSHDLRGSGEPLVLIHGIGHHWQAWLPLLAPLNEAGFQTVAIDLPGFGASPPLPDGQTPTIAALTRAVGSFLDELGLTEAHLVGNSMGGAIALELASAGRARSVSAISPVGFWSRRERVFCQVSLRETFGLVGRWPDPISRVASNPLGRTLLASQICSRPWRTPGEQMRATILAFASSPGFLATLRTFEGYTVGDSPLLVKTPVTIAWGTRDRLLLPRQARRARRVLTHARHVWLPGCGHAPMWDDPELVAGTILSGARH
ncbi:MAG TPA: alpha/beta fold hydrolase [Solirubrobacteraceae bacterium]|jgi:pimeloyl-ACP methyl ester carboxylesterase